MNRINFRTYLRDIESDGKVFCSFCSTTFSITYSARAQVKSHETTSRHKSSVSARAGSSSMNTFLKEKNKPTPNMNWLHKKIALHIIRYTTITVFILWTVLAQ